MSLRFHWFLPTNGDGRDIVGGGHGVATGMLTEVTERLKFLVAFRPGLISPTLAAQMAATFQRYSAGRLLLNVVTGGEPAEQQAYGDFLGKAQRYQRCAEFLDIVTRLWRGETVDHDGEHSPGNREGRAEPVGRRRPAARRRGHRAGRQPHRGRQPDRGVRRPRRRGLLRHHHALRGQLAVRLQRWSGVPLSVHCRTWAPEAVLWFCTPSSSPLL